jgi:hypothetical protein
MECISTIVVTPQFRCFSLNINSRNAITVINTDTAQQVAKIPHNADNAKAPTIRQTNATPSLRNSNAATVMEITKLGITITLADMQKDRSFVR